MRRLGAHYHKQLVNRYDVQPNNIALVPASLLPFKDKWQTISNSLPLGEVLLVVPNGQTPLKRSMCCVAVQLRRQGHKVATIEANQLS